MNIDNLCHEHEIALKQLAKAKLQAIYSLGDKAEALLLEFVISSLKNQSDKDVIDASKVFELVRRHTHKNVPKKSGMYLKLSHGRATPDEHLSDWGRDGPFLGPLSWFYSTYLTDMRMAFNDSEEIIDLSTRSTFPFPIYFVDGQLYCDGIYYGDWEIKHILIKKRKK